MNTGGQLNIFFGLSEYSVWFDLLRILLSGIYLILVVILINAILSGFTLSDFADNDEERKDISINKGMKFFFRNFFSIALGNLANEKKREKSQGTVVIFAFIFLFIIQSNSVVYNYTGVHKEFIVYTSAGDEDIREEGAFILHKNDKEWLSKFSNSLVEDHRFWNDEDPDFDLNTRNFLFVESGFIRGYEPKSRIDQFNREGFWNYIRAIFIFAIEIFVITLLSFVFFLLLLGIRYYFKIKETKKGLSTRP